MTSTFPKTTLSGVGILAIKVIAPQHHPLNGSREIEAYCAGRAARIANWKRDSYPVWLRPDLIEEWTRGWDIIDFAFKHPQRVEEADAE